jgi:DNA-binding XRE family transcriptional regulator
MAKIARGGHPTVDDVSALTLGNIIDDLTRRATDPEQFSIRGVRHSQWRNIAQHFTARVDGPTVICEYRDGQAEIRLSRSELQRVLGDAMSGYKALKVARSVVFFDCVDEMRSERLLPQVAMRPEASLVVLISGLASQGFEVVEARYTPELSHLVVRDVSMLDPTERRIHSTQFVIPLFLGRPAERVVVEYQERDGIPALPFCQSRLAARRPAGPAYPSVLRHIGDHLRKRRLDLGLLQRQVAARIGASTTTITSWELGQTAPALGWMPPIIRFLGYDPPPRPRGSRAPAQTLQGG